MGTNSNSEFQSNPEHKNNNKKVVSETGHAKNVANLQKLTEQVNVYTLYNPPIDNIKVANLEVVLINCMK